MDSSEDDLDETIYTGQKDEDGEPHGRGTLSFNADGKDIFQGHFVHGLKHGFGTFYFNDGSSLAGHFIDDELQGKGVYKHEDGRKTVGHYMDGMLNGYTEEYDENGELIFKGNYVDNVRHGVCHIYDSYGGCLFGVVDKNGAFSGRNIIYGYPDGKTFLKGVFKDGQMVRACEAYYQGHGAVKNPYSYVKVNTSLHYKWDSSTYSCISSNPLLEDPYEQKRVYVKKSTIGDAAEGLFSKIYAEEDVVMSLYNGIRVSHKEVDARDWSFNDNTISLDEKIVIDVPEPYNRLSNYCASLGHKANHSFTPNCKYDRFDHPRFGQIKCIKTIKRVSPDDELTVAYGYDHSKLDTEAPTWYKTKLKTFQMSKHAS